MEPLAFTSGWVDIPVAKRAGTAWRWGLPSLMERTGCMQGAMDKLRKLILWMCIGIAPLPVQAQEEMDRTNTDPWEGFNRKIFVFNETLDKHLLRPVAQGYRKVTPDVVDRGITNIFNNLDDVLVFANSLFQLKGHSAAVSLSRFIFNTTFGIAGFFDVATEFGLEKQEEDFGQTLGYWGVGPGPFLMLPVLGPSTVRDGTARVPEIYLDPAYYWLSVREGVAVAVVKGIDRRADLIPGESLVVGDRYSFIRNSYLQRREYLVKDGQVDDPFASEEFDDDFEF